MRLMLILMALLIPTLDLWRARAALALTMTEPASAQSPTVEAAIVPVQTSPIEPPRLVMSPTGRPVWIVPCPNGVCYPIRR